MWVRGLKRNRNERSEKGNPSHPMWVRGLKLIVQHTSEVIARRTPCGCVD